MLQEQIITSPRKLALELAMNYHFVILNSLRGRGHIKEFLFLFFIIILAMVLWSKNLILPPYNDSEHLQPIFIFQSRE